MEPTVYESQIFALNMETCAKFRPELFELIRASKIADVTPCFRPMKILESTIY